MTERVVVACRVRPPLNTGEAKSVCVTPVDEHRICVGGHRVFSLDRVYDVSCSDETIFRERVAPLIEGFLVGYNTTIMAFGQTGAGKTHTMNAVSPLVVEAVAHHMGGLEHISFQLLEVYGEALHDLLAVPPAAPNQSGASPVPSGGADGGASPATHLQNAKPLQLLEGQTQTHVVGASRVKARTLSEAHTILEHGYRGRTTGATAMNAASSRSHSILTIFNHHKLSKLHLVDLAGSERNKKTHNVGVRLKESIGINTGLLALGNVIRALSKNSSFVPYRASKLTRLLQDSLGGNSRTLFLACVAPDSANIDETIRTLQYSSKAMHVLNEPLPNLDVLQAEQQQQIRRMQAALDLSSDEALRQYADGDEFAAEQGAEIQRLMGVISDLENEVRGARLELKKDETIFADQLKEIRRVKRENGNLQHRVEDLEGQLALLLSEKEQWSNHNRAQHLQHTMGEDSDLLRRAIPDGAVALGKSAASVGSSLYFHHNPSGCYTPPRSGSPSRERQRSPRSLPVPVVGASPMDISVPEYVNLYSAHTSQVPSLLVQPTPVSKTTHDHPAHGFHDVPTAVRPVCVVPTPRTDHHHVVPTPRPTGGSSASKHPPLHLTPSAKIVFHTPPSKGRHFDATDEVQIWTNTLADRLATEDSVLFPSDSPPPSLTRVGNSHGDQRPALLLRNSPIPRNGPLFGSHSTGPTMSSILQSSTVQQNCASGTDAQIHAMLAAVHSQAAPPLLPENAPYGHKAMHLQLDRLLRDHDVLREENAAMRRELRKIQEMIAQC